MNKLLVIYIFIVGIIIFSGCISEEKINSETSIDTQTNQNSDDKISELILKPSDFPSYKLIDHYFYIFPKNEAYGQNSGLRNLYESGHLPESLRIVGQYMEWAGLNRDFTFTVDFKKYDSISGNAGIKDVSTFKDSYKQGELINGAYKFVPGNPNIGDDSFYVSEIYESGERKRISTQLLFVYKNNYVTINRYNNINANEDENVIETIRIAEIVKSKLG